MRYLLTALFILVPTLASAQVVTEKMFRERVVGQPITLAPGVVFTINADNTISGEIEGKPATGTWEFDGRYWCRTITFENIFTEDCQLWRIDGDALVITRDRGRGETFRYKRRQ